MGAAIYIYIYMYNVEVWERVDVIESSTSRQSKFEEYKNLGSQVGSLGRNNIMNINHFAATKSIIRKSIYQKLMVDFVHTA